MPGETGPTLDEEGVPDLEGPLAAKEASGDPQEGISPPGYRPTASVDWGVTAGEQRAGEPLDRRVAREVPDIGETDPLDQVAEDLRLDDDPLGAVDDIIDEVDPVATEVVDETGLGGRDVIGDDLFDDNEAEALAVRAETDLDEAQSAEEAALHVVDDDLV